MQMLGDGEQVVGMDRVRNVSELLFRSDGIAFDVKAADANYSGGWPQNAGDGAERGGFAGAVGSHQTDDFAGMNFATEALDGEEAAVSFAELLNFNDARFGRVHGAMW